MSFIPMVCDHCCHVFLAQLAALDRDPRACQRCGETVRVVPSRSYSERDLELFEELSTTIADSVSPIEAELLAMDLEKTLWSGRHAAAFDALVVRWPGLVPLRVSVGDNSRRQERVLQMVRTVFQALAGARRSGTIAAVRLEPDGALR